jgi:hypothetical protein
MNEKTKTIISNYLEAEQFKKDKDPEVQRLLSSINKVLDTPALIRGKMSTPLVSSVLKPETGGDPLTRVNFNQHFVYRRETGQPLPHFDARDGQDNLTREFASSNPARQTHSGFKIQGNHISQEDFDLYADPKNKMGMSEYREHINKKYLPLISTDKKLQEWAKYNAHMAGPAAACVENLQLIFKKIAEQGFIMDMESSGFNIYTIPSEGNTVYFTARIPFLQAIEESPTDIKRFEGETTRYPAHKDKGVRDPVAVFEITIKGVKTNEGGKEFVQTTLVSENFACYHSNLLPAFDKVNTLVEQRRRFDHLREGLDIDINNFVELATTNKSQQSFFASLFSSAEGSEIIDHIREKLVILVAAIKKDPMNLNYEELTRGLLNFVIEEKQKFLPHPTTEHGKKLRRVLDHIVDNYSADFKEVPPESVQKEGPKATR